LFWQGQLTTRELVIAGYRCALREMRRAHTENHLPLPCFVL